LFSLGDWVIQAKSDVLHLDSSFEKLQIQQTTEIYFDTRYLARKTLQLDEIEPIIRDFSYGDETSFTEMDKL